MTSSVSNYDGSVFALTSAAYLYSAAQYFQKTAKIKFPL